MKYISDFRDGTLAHGLAASIRHEADPARQYAFMEFCGGHTHAISRYGVSDLLPPNVRMIHGPGCPVCVLPIGRIDMAIRLALEHGVTVLTYGDCLRVPASDGLSMLKARALGGDIRMVYSAADALTLARREPDRQVVFFAIGFETTTPPTALVLRQARAMGLSNFSVICNHVLTPSAIQAILDSPQISRPGSVPAVPIDGFIGPGHVSTVTGTQAYTVFAENFRKPVVIAGFEPLDVMLAIRMLIRQVNEGRAEVENEFTRVVTTDGNRKAHTLVSEVFEPRETFEWRGLGSIPQSALRIRPAFADWDAELRYTLKDRSVADHKSCECGAILRGVRKPTDCRLFGSVCTPENPMGACMVSSEGACAAHYQYGRFRDKVIEARQA